jgi:hypothetical protein
MQKRWATTSNEIGLDKPILQHSATPRNRHRQIVALEDVAGSSPVGHPLFSPSSWPLRWLLRASSLPQRQVSRAVAFFGSENTRVPSLSPSLRSLWSWRFTRRVPVCQDLSPTTSNPKGYPSSEPT